MHACVKGPFDMEKINAHCRKAWGVQPRPHHCPITYGGKDLRYASNIVLSNGEALHVAASPTPAPVNHTLPCTDMHTLDTLHTLHTLTP